jgi:hypothetical protein
VCIRGHIVQGVVAQTGMAGDRCHFYPAFHSTDNVAVDWLDALPIRTTTGAAPVGEVAGTTAFTWNKPAMASGAVVAEVTVALMPPI